MTYQKLNDIDLAFADLISALTHDRLTEEQKTLIADLLEEWRHGERMAVLLNDPTVSMERIEEELK
jgi:hypothetical protein